MDDMDAVLEALHHYADAIEEHAVARYRRENHIGEGEDDGTEAMAWRCRLDMRMELAAVLERIILKRGVA